MIVQVRPRRSPRAERVPHPLESPPRGPYVVRMPGWLGNWLERHQHPASRALHAVGIPLTIAAVVLAGIQFSRWQWPLWWRPVLLLGAGYLLQWAGHRIEGNDMGEVVLIKRWLGRPYVAIAPGREAKDR